MANENLIKNGTPIVWADTTDYSSTPSGLTRTHQLDMSSVASGAARQGAKADLGATRAKQYRVLVCFEIASLAASLQSIDIYWAESPSATAANANPANTTGSDAAYAGTAGDSLADSLEQLQQIGSHITTSDNTTPQYSFAGILTNPGRYGMPVVYNGSSGAMVAVADEIYVALIPIIDETQP